ncbi:MAG: GntG family PLP-dependent aldolase [Bacteroidota bacterium]
MIDLRSDTVTKPTASMLAFMQKAQVGDDVFGEDPSINALEEKSAQLFGKEAGIFCPSGTMTNQIAINVHTQPGDEVICHRLSHIYNYEGGGIAKNSGASVRLLEGNRGNILADEIKKNINPDDVHHPITRLVALEDTCNKAGGAILDFEEIKKVRSICHEGNLNLHLDGARLFNRLVASPIDYKVYADQFDSISLCLSKGLGAPVGSLLLGTHEFISKARRIRKVFGGGMRQAGIIAAGGLFALENHVERLAEDHKHATSVESVLKELPHVESVNPVETNIIVFHLRSGIDPDEYVLDLANRGVLCFSIGAQAIRFVFHLDVKDEQVEELIKKLKA